MWTPLAGSEEEQEFQKLIRQRKPLQSPAKMPFEANALLFTRILQVTANASQMPFGSQLDKLTLLGAESGVRHLTEQYPALQEALERINGRPIEEGLTDLFKKTWIMLIQGATAIN